MGARHARHGRAIGRGRPDRPRPAFAAAVRAWEDRLAPLDDDTAPVPPPAAVWSRIEAAVSARSPAAPATARSPVPTPASASSTAPASPTSSTSGPRLGRWRATAAAAMAAAAALAAVAVIDRLPQPAPSRHRPVPGGGELRRHACRRWWSTSTTRPRDGDRPPGRHGAAVRPPASSCGRSRRAGSRSRSASSIRRPRCSGSGPRCPASSRRASVRRVRGAAGRLPDRRPHGTGDLLRHPRPGRRLTARLGGGGAGHHPVEEVADAAHLVRHDPVPHPRVDRLVDPAPIADRTRVVALTRASGMWKSTSLQPRITGVPARSPAWPSTSASVPISPPDSPTIRRSGADGARRTRWRGRRPG